MRLYYTSRCEELTIKLCAFRHGNANRAIVPRRRHTLWDILNVRNKNEAAVVTLIAVIAKISLFYFKGLHLVRRGPSEVIDFEAQYYKNIHEGSKSISEPPVYFTGLILLLLS